MRTLSAHLARFLEILLVALLAALVVLAAGETLAWTFFDRSWAPAEEITELLQTWFALLAAAWLVRRGLHLRLEAVTDRLAPRLRLWVSRLAAAGVGLFGVLLAVYGARLAATVTNTLPATGLGASMQYVPAAVAGAVIAFFAVEEVVAGAPGDAP